jgi:hypothetical protein
MLRTYAVLNTVHLFTFAGIEQYYKFTRRHLQTMSGRPKQHSHEEQTHYPTLLEKGNILSPSLIYVKQG